MHEYENLYSTRLFHQKRNYIVKKPLGVALISLLFVLGLQYARQKRDCCGPMSNLRIKVYSRVQEEFAYEILR